LSFQVIRPFSYYEKDIFGYKVFFRGCAWRFKIGTVQAFWKPVPPILLPSESFDVTGIRSSFLLPVTNHSEGPKLERHTLLVLDERPEAELVALALAGDADAFAKLIERTMFIAKAMAKRLINNQETVREVLQEATMQAFLSLGQLRDATRFKSWFSGIVLNLCRTWLREQSSNQEVSLEVLAEATTLPFPLWVVSDPYKAVEEQELRRLVQEAIAGLPSINRTVIWLFYYEQMSMQEIASALTLALSTVRNRLYQGRKELRRQLLVEVKYNSWLYFHVEVIEAGEFATPVHGEMQPTNRG
jgi:RNA polymerase sigma factor (sigma-70 family)